MQTVESILVDLKNIDGLTDTNSEAKRDFLIDQLELYLEEKRNGRIRMRMYGSEVENE